MGKKNTDIREIIQKSTLKNAWEHIGISKHHGLNIPLFSIHSKDSCGIGEFLDLLLLIDFCAQVGMDIIQLLPLNDSGYETSPYNAVSSKALNPIYLSLHALPYIKGDEELTLELKTFKKYTHLQRIAYNAVLSAKLHFMHLYFEKHFTSLSSTSEYKTFVKKHPWVNEYGLFKCLKEDYAHKGWFSWKTEEKNISHRHKKALFKKRSKEIDFYIFLQFLSFRQLEEVKKYAEGKNVFLKGDIPILISPESLDVWIDRESFNLDFSAGAPPDKFAAEGQNWGFPIFNWAHTEKTDYAFWKDRLHAADHFYHLYRIDHIIGFYRIYAIPRGKDASMGKFIPNNRSLATRQGQEVLSKLTSFTAMLPIGEDLGADGEIEYIRKSLRNQAIAGTKIPRWEKSHDDSSSFTPYAQYHPLSLTTVSTHDSETLTLWWDNNPKDAKSFCDAMKMRYTKNLSTDLRYKILKDSHNTTSLFHINLLPEYLALFDNLIWESPKQERINLPGTVLPSNWCYKTRPSLEILLRHEGLKEAIKSMLAA